MEDEMRLTMTIEGYNVSETRQSGSYNVGAIVLPVSQVFYYVPLQYRSPKNVLL